MTLRHRIAAVAGLAVAITVLIAAAAVFVAVRAQLHQQIDDALRARAHELTGGDERANGGADPCGGADTFPAPVTDRDDARLGGAEGYAQFVCADGTVLRPAGAGIGLPVSARARALARERSDSDEDEAFADVEVRGTRLRVLTIAQPSLHGAVQVARPLTEVDHSLRDILLVLAVVAAAGVALAAALGAVVAGVALAPVRRFTRRTEEIAGNPDPVERIAVKGDDELARLARSFNSTLDALERSVEAQRHLVADASHELRTPIASLRANVQTLEDSDRLPEHERAALRADIIEELDELTDLVADVVELARGSKPGRVLDDVHVDRIVASQVRRARGRGGVDVAFRADLEPTVVRGEPDRVNRAVANLIENAVKWSPPGSEVEIGLRGGTLTVRDHGPGFGHDDLPHIFERFYRAEGSRDMPGSGLGLAIVRQAAEAHGGSVEAANAPGGGALIRVRFAP
ncbi:MAG TPA: HAMP domain-containing sensor histidine kinase [Solirubrobacteraceae bacterium]|nr:HAMP domain-containing sensor histidine kinase [Solirubrobacteraceae bacterium]